MTEIERQLRRRDRLRLGAVLALCLLIAVPVVVAMAASPSTGTEPAATQPEATTKADPTTRPDKSLLDKLHIGKGGLGLGGGRFGGGFSGGGFGGGGVTITAIDGSKISLKTEDGWTRTVTISADTVIRKGGVAAKVADLSVGDAIRFAQKRNDDGSYTITAIEVPVPMTGGEVTSVDGNTLTIKLRGGDTRKITLTATTTYRLGKDDAKKGDIKVGSRIVVRGTTSGDAFTATSVQIQLSFAGGTVTKVTKDSVTVKDRKGDEVVIHVSDKTRILIFGDTTPKLSDIAVGDRVEAAGTLRADGSLDASALGKHPARRDKQGQPGAPKGSAAPTS